MTVYDVIIAGAGPAGSALAIELAGAGYSVLLMDGARFPRDKVCGDYVSPRGLGRLEALGCGDAVRALACTPIRSSRLYLNSERLVSGSLPRVPGLPAYGLAIPRRDLDELLFRRALAAGAEGREACRVSGFEVTGAGVEVAAVREGKPHRALGRLLVGADGATSVVARTAGMGMNDSRYTLASIRAYAHDLTIDHTIMYFDEKYFPGYGWVFPVRPGLCNIGVGMVSEPLVRGGLKLPEFYAKFQRFVMHLGRAHGVEPRLGPQRGWPIHSYGGAHRNYFERGLLIGEAGCFVDPINGEGIPLALETARIAASTIRAAFRQGRFGAAVLSQYELDFRAALDPDLAISDLAVAMIRNRHLLPLWLTSFRGMCHTARSDPHYAQITGGILGGVIPARAALSPEMFARTLRHVPGFLREMFSPGDPQRPADRLAEGLKLLRWQYDLARAVVRDGPWFRAWLGEVESKQRRLAAQAVRSAVAGAT